MVLQKVQYHELRGDFNEMVLQKVQYHELRGDFNEMVLQKVQYHELRCDFNEMVLQKVQCHELINVSLSSNFCKKKKNFRLYYLRLHILLHQLSAETLSDKLLPRNR